ncbi:MAG: indolepyruvate ferredoxin oxidoreductase subunit alpha [Clostridia bacterium]
MKMLLTGNEAIARGVYESGCVLAAAYPGTPSTEIMENISTQYKEIMSEWSPNEKVALETAFGGTMAGGRSFASMKHVGLNVAADPLFTIAYSGVNAGLVIVTADEPGQFSSQNEQDNRNYARAAKIPMLEPSDSSEALAMTKLAFDISEMYDTPVLLRMTTRVCHSKSIVTLGERKVVAIKPYVKNAKKYVDVPVNAILRRAEVEKHMIALKEYSETSTLNYVENNNSKIGVITSGMCLNYAKEVFATAVNYLKIGFSFPLPTEKINAFCKGLEKIYVIEENDAFIEDEVRKLGYDCLGNNFFPVSGELTSDILRSCVNNKAIETIPFDKNKVVARPPALCAGCPHRGFFYEISKRKDIVVSGDIGCYTLAFAPPYNAMDFNCCMGASISAGNGFQKVINMVEGNTKRVVSVLGDSTFFHSGMTSLLDVVYNNGNSINVILDNRITGMTGHQENPGSGYNAQGDVAPITDIEALVKAIGIKHVTVIDPNDLTAVNKALDDAISINEASVIITRFPCVLKKMSIIDKSEFPQAFKDKCVVDTDKCVGCKLCLKCGCPALSVINKKAKIDASMCVGCQVCKQICKVSAIKVGGNNL